MRTDSRFDPDTRELTMPGDGFETPNGLAFNLDHTGLYVADTVMEQMQNLANAGVTDFAASEFVTTPEQA